ncbi:MAG: glycosyltransferase family 2 protein [Provencibacterium sp.]|jgi:galactofuranosylgalactofuranosylrhamnosyl-N-acetylglucosaminyl-diphospho-decaprenol beta-1,5/1,6-galactofuranosyltransferase|nr:glycosyltransferase family 2 protein [Provencibacterium sp.]
MTLFEITLPGYPAAATTELYYRAVPDSVRIENGALRLKAGSTVTFDTYFNLFPYRAYRRYASLERVGLCLRAEGCLRIRIRHCHGAQRCEEDAVLLEEEMKEGGSQTFPFSLSSLETKEPGFLYLEVEAVSSAVFSGGSFCALHIRRLPEFRLAAVICTYRREPYLTQNLAQISEYLSLPEHRWLREKLDIWVVDNGRTVRADQIPAGVTLLSSGRNLGGSGGFARGMWEIGHSARGYTHFCLMDDDIVLDPGILLRTAAFLELSGTRYPDLALGAAMISLDRPWEQYEMGGGWDGYRCSSFGQGADLRRRETLLQNEQAASPLFGAWWYLCMPCSFIRRFGLPFPFFVKGDDIDYGLRTAYPLLLMNGMGIWHEDFSGKDFGISEYYVKRNELILCALHTRRPSLLKNYQKLVFAAGKQLLLRRYAVVRLLLRAYKDFLLGGEAFLELDQEQQRRELGAGMPELLGEKELVQTFGISLGAFPVKDCSGKLDWRIRIKAIAAYLLPGSQKRPLRCIEVSSCSPEDFLYSGPVLQYSRKLRAGFLSPLRKRELWTTAAALVDMLWQMLLHYQSACRSFRRIYSKAASEEYWRGKF